MFENFEEVLPVEWKGIFRLIVLPISWIIPVQSYLLEAAWTSHDGSIFFFNRIFFLLPVLAVIVGLWCTMLSAYTILFRKNRVQVVTALFVSWWDALRGIWFFYAGIGRFFWVLIGSVWGLFRMMVSVGLEMIREGFALPFVLTGALTKNLRQPGVPWLAFFMTIGWSLLEATIFTYILTPTFNEILSDLVGSETHQFLPYILFTMLFFMIAGSFACMHVFVEAIRNKDVKGMIQMGIIEGFVMGVEVMFLYRELVDALTPWIAQQTGIRMGLFPVLFIASGGWIGVRGMVWFLFARFGTPTMLAVIARQRLSEEGVDKTSGKAAEQRWTSVIDKIKDEQDWFHKSGEALVSAAVLPVFQLVAAALNFCFVLFLSRPLFNLPFQSLEDLKDTKLLLKNHKKALEEGS